MKRLLATTLGVLLLLAPATARSAARLPAQARPQDASRQFTEADLVGRIMFLSLLQRLRQPEIRPFVVVQQANGIAQALAGVDPDEPFLYFVS